jgi:acetate kinase
MSSVLVFNIGSGSQQVSLYRNGASNHEFPREAIWEARIDSTAPDQPEDKLYIEIKHGSTPLRSEVSRSAKLEQRIQAVLNEAVYGKGKILDSFSSLTAVAHRVVHGGQRFSEATEITDEVEHEIERLCEFSPLHNPVQFAAIRVAKNVIGPPVKHYAVFDTAFHRTLPDAAKVYPGPFDWVDKKIIRYGFHGSSFRYATNRIAEILGQSSGRRLIICHLGGGCSLAAVHGDRSVDTTMGFSPLDGIAMCTRSGGVDPGILIHLIRQGATADSLEQLLNKHSGLAGLSGLPGDTRIVLPAANQGNKRARLAMNVFIHRLQSGIGSMLAALGGCDVLAFTDAIGESEPAIRSAACAPFAFLGLHLDEQKNRAAKGDTEISVLDSVVRVYVIHSQESWQVGWEALREVRGER